MKYLTNAKRLEPQSPRQERAKRADATRSFDFRPAYFDFATCTLYLSRFENGLPAPIHLLEGLPDEAVAVRSPCGRVLAPRATIIAGFERNGFFYTRSAAMRAAIEWEGLPRAH